RFEPRESSPTEFSIAPGRDKVGAGGGLGRISGTAPGAYAWSASGVPDWITIADGAGSGGGMIRYGVAEKWANESSAAKIQVGKSGFEISQPRSAYHYTPFIEEFKQLPLPVWDMRAPDPISPSDPPSRWFLDNQSNQNVTVKIAAGPPEGGGVLIIE